MRLFLLVVFLTTFNVAANADPRVWGNHGIPIRQSMHLKWNQGMARDASGNTLLVWSEKSTGQRDVRAQLINSSGQEQWVSGGLNVAPETHFQDCPVVASVPGGWIVVWADFRDTTGCSDYWNYYACAGVFAQKLDYSGNRLWPENDFTGVTVHTGEGDKFSIHILPDGSSGAFVTWSDYAFVYAQRITSNGDVVWPQPVQVSDTDYVEDLRIAPGSDGSMLIAWDTYQNYVQGVHLSRVMPDGTLPWGVSGLVVSTTPSSQVRIMPDGADGCYVAWRDMRDSNSGKIFAQHLQSDGQALWQANGIVISDSGGSNPALALSSNNGQADGMVAIWQQAVLPNTSAVYAQKISPEGVAAWQAGGMLVANLDQNYWYFGPTLTSDHNGGLVAVWQNLAQQVPQYFATRIRSNGILAWGQNPVPVGGGASSTNYYDQELPVLGGDFGSYFVSYVGMDTVGRESIHYQMLDHVNGSRQLGPNGASAVSGVGGDAYLALTAPLSNHRTAFFWQSQSQWGSVLYYQIVGSDGRIQRAADGERLTPNRTGSTYLSQYYTKACNDGAGGLLISYYDDRSSGESIRASHIHPSGDVSPDSGMIVWTAQGAYQTDPFITPDGEDGCYVAWSQHDPNDSTNLLVMRLNSDLQRAWNQPVQLPHARGNTLYGLVNSGDNCCMAVWQNSNHAIVASGVCNEGTVLWNDTVCAASGTRSNPVSVSDGFGGAYIVWQDARNGHDQDIYAQRISADGILYWTANGIPVCSGTDNQIYPQVVLDSGGDLCVLWCKGAEYGGDTYAQRLTPDGNLLWNSGGVLVNHAFYSYSSIVVASSRDGVFPLWEYGDISATHLDSTGNVFDDPFWRPDSGGKVDEQEFPHNSSQGPNAASDNWGGCVVGWNEWEDEYEYSGDITGGEVSTADIYAQRLYDYTTSAGNPEDNLPHEYALHQNYPNPFNPNTLITFDLPKAGMTKLTVFNLLGREVTTLVDQHLSVGNHRVNFDASQLSSGIYFYRLQSGSFTSTRKMIVLK